jgi:hypothetical protein
MEKSSNRLVDGVVNADSCTLFIGGNYSWKHGLFETEVHEHAKIGSSYPGRTRNGSKIR